MYIFMYVSGVRQYTFGTRKRSRPDRAIFFWTRLKNRRSRAWDLEEVPKTKIKREKTNSKGGFGPFSPSSSPNHLTRRDCAAV